MGRCHCHLRLVSHIIPPIRSLRPYHSPISWFLDNPELGWSPPRTLVDWIAKARTDGKPIVYIGFGSITVPDPKLVTERIIRGVLKSEWGVGMTTLSLIPALRWCACDYIQRMVGPDVERWERRCRVPRRMLFGTAAALAFCLACTDALMFAVAGQSAARVSSVPT